MTNARYYHTASLLTNGKVLVTGGYGLTGSNGLKSAELYDPSAGIWTATSNMTDGRYLHTASVLANGKTLVTGGAAVPGTFLNSAELY
jgi:hypothetical protein